MHPNFTLDLPSPLLKSYTPIPLFLENMLSFQLIKPFEMLQVKQHHLRICAFQISLFGVVWYSLHGLNVVGSLQNPAVGSALPLPGSLALASSSHLVCLLAHLCLPMSFINTWQEQDWLHMHKKFKIQCMKR